MAEYLVRERTLQGCSDRRETGIRCERVNGGRCEREVDMAALHLDVSRVQLPRSEMVYASIQDLLAQETSERVRVVVVG
jgi:hypothetical protein